jgi:hypothetical protein
MKNKNNLITVGLVIVFTGIGFFAGIKYQQAKQPSFFRTGSNGFQRGQMRTGTLSPGTASSGAEMIRGKVISKDENSITIGLDDGSSKVVLISDSTQINKTVEAASGDLAKDDQVMVFGQADSSGAVTASQIQVNFGQGGFMQPETK